MRLDADHLRDRAEAALEALSPCRVCPRACGARRLEGELGTCRIGKAARVASWGPHFGEEPPLVGYGGSGTIFLYGCNLACLFCQNHDISQGPPGAPVPPEGLATMALSLQERGCHNVNLVSPTHVMPQVLAGLALARERGLDLPVVWNTGGYESVETLRLLEGVVDIYMPDVKYWDPATGERLSGVADYPERTREALIEMHRQVGDLELDEAGVAVRGLLVRHLVLPGDRAGTFGWMEFLAREISPDTWINVMGQYWPAHRAPAHTGLDRRPSPAEMAEAGAAARSCGLHRGILGPGRLG
jgi:putative pyruvate formate lyase activating enzyme